MGALLDTIITGHDLTFNLQFERDEDSGWFIAHVVELPGCVSQGATLEEAKKNIASALESCIEVLLEDAIRKQGSREEPVSVKSTATETAQVLVRPRFEVRV
ncbi:MAG TPA: type II toxin-antitoxin system HicB family antitoxin [Bryobacteraceae bacterium]